MPKMKTKAGAKKRFKLTGSGKLKRKHAFKSNILTTSPIVLYASSDLLINIKIYKIFKFF